MALTNEPQRPFRLYVTHVDGEAHFLKISGQLDQQSSLMIESLFESARENLEKGIGAAPPAAIHEGIICAAKYKDGAYYRAKIISTANLANGLVGVQFIDYGNKNVISLSTIRFLDNYDPMFLELHGQATDYYLSRVISPSGRWEESLILKLQGLLCYSEYPATIEAQTRTLPIISIQYKGIDLSTHLVTNRIGVALPVPKQEVILLQMTDNQQKITWSPPVTNEAPYFTEHVPFLINQNFPNPASAMRINQNVPPLPFNGAIAHSGVSQRLHVNKVSRNAVNLRAPERQPHIHTAALSPQSHVLPPSPKKSTTYKSRLLEVNSEHKVFVSYAEEGPELFAVQLVVDAKKLQDMMDDINRRPHSSLAEPPMIGTVCLGRMSGDRIICRAIVMNLSGSQCKLFFVDFGDTEMVSYYDIFDIPEEFVKPNVFAMRFCLSGVKTLDKSPHLNEAFKQLVNGKVLTLKVVAPEGPPLIQYGQLFFDNQNVLDILTVNMKDKLQFKWMEMLPLGSKQSVLVSYVDSCIKFYMQLSDNIDALNAVMDAVKIHCKNSSSPGELPVGAVCCARFPDDDEWYRAMVRAVRGNEVTVIYVDYGNEQDINISDLRTITPDLIRLPAQAMKCALKGFENKPIEKQTSNQLEMLALEKTLMAHVVGLLSSDTMLVTLIDDTASPPLDVARRMTQLSQPRSNVETKAPPLRKESQETISSPESVVSDDSRKRGFRREKSFKDERKPRENEEFGQHGGSLRNREPRDGFERAGAGRHSDKFSGKQDRGDRRKPRENTSADDWEDAPAPSVRQNRDNRERKKSKDHQEKAKNWKKDLGGVGKRLRQAAEAASADARAHKPSIQDRLKRGDNRFTQNEENNFEERGNRFKTDRPNRERRDNWGDKKENWGDKKENWGEKKESWGDKKESWGDKKESWGDKKESWGDKKDSWGDKKEGWNQKREFRDNRSERGGRSDRGGRGGRSNFNSRETAERSFGSESDKRSDKSFSHNRGDRAPYKPRESFSQVQYKELPDPVALETPFTEPTVEIGSQQEVSVTWIISPENFFTQILSLQAKFLEMMHKIPDLYKGVKSYTGAVQVGASVLARYPADGVLYRATIVSAQPFSKFIVRYIDFGNKQLVDAKDIWQLDRQLMELPKMAVHCSLLGVAPIDGEWKANPEIDICFNAPRYQCVFQECVEEQYMVYLWNNGVSVADTLVEKQLAIMADNQSAVTLRDEPIDLTIIVGQQINCRVTHVESFEKFYVQLDLDKATLVENSIAEYDATKLQPLPVESMANGVDCTVKHEDKVYRAILSDVSDPAAIKAVLPDYGHEITTSLDNFMILPTELSVYYYQSLECCLNNYTSESETLMTLEELKEKLTGNKFIIYINYIDGIRLVATLYEAASGAKVCLFSPDEGAFEAVVPLCARAVFNYSFGRAYVAHVESLAELYLQRAGDDETLAQLLNTMYSFYEEGTPEVLADLEIEGLCAAKSSDGNWYRATIVSFTDTEATVLFSDYGNSETVLKESLRVLDPKFYEPCNLALVASLGLVASREDAVEKFKELTAEKEVQVTLAFGKDGWLTNLHLDGVDLSLHLISEKYAAPQITAENEPEVQAAVPAEEPISLPEGCTQVYISHIDTPGQFWLQMSDKVNNIEEIQAELQTNADGYADIDTRELGTICVAKYSADDQWYRAEILDSDTDITTVRFIDYGNTDVLDNLPDLIKTIPEHLKKIEKYAIRSSVNAIPTGTGQWSEPASEYFTQLVGDLSAPVDALIILKDVSTYVDIYVNGQNLTDKLVSEGHATRSEEAECGDLPSCFASHVNSPSEFWIQLESATPELQAMEAAMIDAENFPELKEKEEGVICAAKYPEDGAWYRAQIIVDGSEGTEVLFMDYGNASITNELRSMPDELKTKPALSRKCALQKPRDIKSWSRKSEHKFNDLAAEGATIFNVQFIAAGDISIVELHLEGKSVTEELVGLCEEHPASERPTPVGQDLHSSGKICYINSLEEFYVHLDDSVSNIDKVTEILTASDSFEQVSELKVGSLCAAFCSEDEQWYRGKILEFCDVGYHVQFVDYGNKAKCEYFRQLPESLSDIEPLAKCCRLAGFIDDPSNESAKSKLNDLVEELVTFQIEFLDSLKEPFLVKLLLNNTDLSTVLKSDLDVNSEALSDNIGGKDNDMITGDSNENESQILNNSHSELNDSIDSAKTVVENNSYQEKDDDINNENDLNVSKECDKSLAGEQTPEVDKNNKIENMSSEIENNTNLQVEAETKQAEDVLDCEIDSTELRNKDDKIETIPEKSIIDVDNSKKLEIPVKDKSSDSINIDTGYTSETLSSEEVLEVTVNKEETLLLVKKIEVNEEEISADKKIEETLSPDNEMVVKANKEATLLPDKEMEVKANKEETLLPDKEMEEKANKEETLLPDKEMEVKTNKEETLLPDKEMDVKVNKEETLLPDKEMEVKTNKEETLLPVKEVEDEEKKEAI